MPTEHSMLSMSSSLQEGSYANLTQIYNLILTVFEKLRQVYK